MDDEHNEDNICNAIRQFDDLVRDLVERQGVPLNDVMLAFGILAGICTADSCFCEGMAQLGVNTLRRRAGQGSLN